MRAPIRGSTTIIRSALGMSGHGGQSSRRPVMTDQNVFPRQSGFGLQVLASVCALALITAPAFGGTNPKHFFWAPNQRNAPSSNSLANDLIYHGGNAGSGAIGVETKPATYLIFWGPAWSGGFTTTDANGSVYTSQQLQNYITSFLTNLGGTSWAAIQNEYCRNVPAGTTSCADITGADYVTNPRK